MSIHNLESIAERASIIHWMLQRSQILNDLAAESIAAQDHIEALKTAHQAHALLTAAQHILNQDHHNTP